MPATHAVSERSFSALRKDMTASTGQVQFNWCLTLDAHKERTDALSMTSIASEFVLWNSSRMNIFGKFED